MTGNRNTLFALLVIQFGLVFFLHRDLLRLDANVAGATLVSTQLVPETAERLQIDTGQSLIKWKGTKLMGTGFHEGTVTFKSGELLLGNGGLQGGSLVVNMKSIYNTDIPLSDPVPRRNLTNHLNSDFDTDRFPTATFVLAGVNRKKEQTYSVTGDLTIRGITQSITIEAREVKDGHFEASFSFDRFNWKIGENGSWLAQRLVDADVMLDVTIILKK